MLNKTIKGSDFDNIFTEVIHSESLGLINPEQLRLFHLNVMNNEFVSDDLQAFIRKNVGRYVFSRAKLEQFKINDDLESIGLEAMAVMQKNGRPGQQNTGNSLGEILLYAFLESVLDAPKIYSKVELNRTVRSGNSNCDSIHLKVLPQTGNTLNFEMVFGSSSVVGDLGIAIDNAFEQVKRIKGHRSDEMKIVDQTVFDLPEDDPIAVQVQEIITPKEGTAVNRDSAYGIFLGYTLGLRKDRPDYRQAVDKKMEADIKKYLPQLQNHIKTLGLTGRSFYVYIVPFDDAETDKNTVMKKVMRKGD